MIEKDSLKSLMADIDKIVSGELVIAPDYEHEDEGYKELLILSQLLARADFSAGIPERMKKMIADGYHKGQLDDDELDLVAGGVNPDAIRNEKEKKDR